jgi:hypothetical protein
MRSSAPARGSAARTWARGQSPPQSRLQRRRRRADQIVHFLVQNRGTYDRHKYRAEKRQAFEALAALVERIINPVDNLVALTQPLGPR